MTPLIINYIVQGVVVAMAVIVSVVSFVFLLYVLLFCCTVNKCFVIISFKGKLRCCLLLMCL